MFIAGIDGGGTSTKLEIRTAENRFVRRESFGAFNISTIGEEGFAARLREVLAACGDMADCAAICFGSAGISVGAAGEIIRRELADVGFAGRLILRGDHEIALRGAITGAGGILIAGTGSICCGVDENGRFARVGGWGHLIDDGGSGYAIGRDALALTVRGEDGRAPRGALHDTVLRRTGAADARGIVEFTYHGASKAEVAALAAEVLRLAAEGDAQSAAILRREAAELLRQAAALAQPDGLVTPLAESGRCLRELLPEYGTLGREAAELSRVLERGKQQEQRPAAFVPLTEREWAVAQRMARRLSNREIAGQLFLTEGTVKQYINQIYSKLHLTGDARTKRRRLEELMGE